MPTTAVQASRLASAWCLIAAIGVGASALAEPPAEPLPSRVRIDTTQGSFVVQLETVRAPLTVANFVSYARSGFYDATIFHRVIANFVVQGGGYDAKFQLKPTSTTVVNESGNGLSNKRGTVGLARTELAHSGNAQFYINLTDNDDLDPTPVRWGYAVFGRIVEGLEVVDRIGRTPTGATGPWPRDAPLEPVIIKHVELLPAAGAPPASAAPPAVPPPAAAH